MDSQQEKRAEVLNKFDYLLNSIGVNTQVLISESTSEQNNREAGDASTYYIQAKSIEIENLQQQVTHFNDPACPSSREYRILQGNCEKLQTDLDKVDVFGRDDLRASRKAALLAVESLMKQLGGKAHPRGVLCHDCKFKNK